MKEKRLIAKAWAPVYCPKDHVVAITVRNIYVGEAAAASNYIAVGTGRINRHMGGSCDLYCGECYWPDAMWKGIGGYMIRTDKRADHGGR